MRLGLSQKWPVFLPVFLAILLISDTSFAHTRKYVFNQEYRTLPQGGFEIEAQTDLKVPDKNISRINTWEYQPELEYGLTDHWTVAAYQIWQTKNVQGPDDSTTYKGFKFETKYRLGEKGKYWLDPLLYLEWKTNVREKENPNELEGKIVLSKDFGPINVVYNQVMESELGSGGRTEHGFTAGVTCDLLFGFNIGMEAKGTYWNPKTHHNEFAVGPTLAWEGKYFWVASGVAFGTNKAADDVEWRITVGIPFG